MFMSIVQKPAPGYTNEQLLLTLFTVCLLMHFGFAPDFLPFTVLLLAIACVALLFNPFDGFWPVVAVIAAMFQTGMKYPEVANHAALEFFISGGILFLVVRKWFGFKTPFFTPEQKSTLFRIVAFIVYFLTGFHKLNRGFLDPDTSCANEINLTLFRYFMNEGSSLPIVFIRFLQASTLFAELVVPFGLLFARTRTVAAVGLFFFHAWLCWFGFANFASFGLFFITGCLIDFRDHSFAKKIKPFLKIYIPVAVVAAVLAFAICNWGGKRLTGTNLSPYFLTLSVFFGFVYVFAARLVILNQKQNTITYPFSWKVVLPAIFVFLWGTQCYYGISNRSNLTMYSNLITETSRSNHLLIHTANTKLFHFEEDNLRIQKVSNNLLPHAGAVYAQYIYPKVLFRNRMKQWAEVVKEPVYIRVLYQNRIYEVRDLQSNPFMQSKWYDRFLYFRETPEKGVGYCMW
jgi:hypothetical protein